MKLYIGNVAKTASSADLQNLLSPYGCTDCQLYYDLLASRSVGFCTAVVSDGLRALREINGKMFFGQVLKAVKAVDRNEQGIAAQ